MFAFIVAVDSVNGRGNTGAGGGEGKLIASRCTLSRLSLCAVRTALRAGGPSDFSSIATVNIYQRASERAEESQRFSHLLTVCA